MKSNRFAIGIVCAKNNSNRFPGKNLYMHHGKPMFYHSVKPLLESQLVDDVYVSTDSDEITKYCKDYRINVIHRNINVTEDEEPLISVLKYSYQTLEISSEYICTIMANCPGHSAKTVDDALRLIKKEKLDEVRSYNDMGLESGLIVLKEDIVLNASRISSHLGLLRSNIREIHYKTDIDT